MKNTSKVVYPEIFKSSYVIAHHNLEQDLVCILEKSGLKAVFTGMYKQRLRFLETYRENCIAKHDWFEKLKHENKLYSMKFKKAKKNIRILFVLLDIDEKKHVLLLHGFEEKERNDYFNGIKIANNRLSEVL